MLLGPAVGLRRTEAKKLVLALERWPLLSPTEAFELGHRSREHRSTTFASPERGPLGGRLVATLLYSEK